MDTASALDSNLGSPTGQAAYPYWHAAEVAVRGTALMLDLQLESARKLLQMQARTVAMLGAVDCSALLALREGRGGRFFADGADQLIDSTRRANRTLLEVSRQITRLLEHQSLSVAEQVRHGIEQLGRHTEETFGEARSLVERGLDEVERAALEARRQASEQPGWQAASKPVEPTFSATTRAGKFLPAG